MSWQRFQEEAIAIVKIGSDGEAWAFERTGSDWKGWFVQGTDLNITAKLATITLRINDLTKANDSEDELRDILGV